MLVKLRVILVETVLVWLSNLADAETLFELLGLLVVEELADSVVDAVAVRVFF